MIATVPYIAVQKLKGKEGSERRKNWHCDQLLLSHVPVKSSYRLADILITGMHFVLAIFTRIICILFFCEFGASKKVGVQITQRFHEHIQNNVQIES